MVDANGYGEETETLALTRKGLDSGSDVRVCKMVDQVCETLALRKGLDSGSDVAGGKMVIRFV
ncbi:Transcription Elongation Factor A N-Terminal And Central Domain-Containing Protein, partial [Manis pentadactyla]